MTVAIWDLTSILVSKTKVSLIPEVVNAENYIWSFFNGRFLECDKPLSAELLKDIEHLQTCVYNPIDKTGWEISISVLLILIF